MTDENNSPIQLQPLAVPGNQKGFAKTLAVAIKTAALLLLLFHLGALLVFPQDPYVFRSWHLALIAVFSFLVRAEDEKRLFGRLLLLALGTAALSFAIYIAHDTRGLALRAGVLPTSTDLLFACFALVIVMELTWRYAGPAIVFLSIAFIFYALFGNHLPPAIGHQGYPVERVVTSLYTTNGIFSVPLGSSATFIYLFIFLGSLLTVSKTGDYLLRLANAIAGNSYGGPAKVAVIASGFFGMINGTSAGNVVSTGALTIPLMKRSGYKANFSAAVEAAASSGGQILPPVMGAAAFLMIEMTGIPYSEIIVSAAFPAALYFVAILAMVHFEAMRSNVRNTGMAELSGERSAWKDSYKLLPIAVLLICLLGLKVSIILSAVYTALCAILVSWVSRETAIGPKRFIRASVETAEGMLAIAATCATAGIIIGVLNITGLGLKLATFIVMATGGFLPLILLLTMIVTIILGMGMPTVAAYAITGAVVAPAMVRAGVDIMAAHLFVMYFSAMSAITPPVALASYAAAAIARGNVNAVGWLGMKLGAAGFIVPFIFITNEGVLMVGDPQTIATAVLRSAAAIIAIAAALLPPASGILSRALLVTGAAILVFSASWISVAGAVLIGCGAALMRRNWLARS